MNKQEQLAEQIVGILYKNKTDEADEGTWIESKDFYKAAAAIVEAMGVKETPINNDIVPIYRFQLKAIESALFTVANQYNCREQKNCLDRMVTQAEQFATNALNGKMYKTVRYAASAKVEAMGVHQESDYVGKSATQVLKEHGISIMELNDDFNTQLLHAMERYAEEKAKTVEAMPESDYKYSLNEKKFQELQFKGIGISDEQTFEQRVNTAIALAWECIELRKKLEAIESATPNE
jgi:hypothetical protein